MQDTASQQRGRAATLLLHIVVMTNDTVIVVVVIVVVIVIVTVVMDVSNIRDKTTRLVEPRTHKLLLTYILPSTPIPSPLLVLDLRQTLLFSRGRTRGDNHPMV